jgi:type I restriction enzyme S subunit
MLEMEATINQHIAYIHSRSTRVSPDYLQMYLIAAYAELRRISEASGSTKGALTCEDIKRFKVTIPPSREQQQLVAATREELATIEATIDCTQREIALIREYRARLIADVVTGKVDVRAVAAALPAEEDENPAELDEALPEETEMAVQDEEELA